MNDTNPIDPQVASPEAPESPAHPAPCGVNPSAPAPEAPQATAPLTPAQLADLEARAAKADEHWDRFLRTAADFENYKKRAARERQEAARVANEKLLESLLPVLDHFEMAIVAADSATSPNVESLRAGIQMILGQLRTVLTDAGLEEIPAIGQPFDPNIHEAIAQLESTEVAEGVVLQQVRKGYRYRDRLLRPSRVVVARPPAG
ncbi:MAG TPA: nucleotide exchange factor GrpE [Verrucomicrobiota bacterium]|nr:nucleotide exchange factor GrpE [Verrucomicrobiota bacterium]HNU50421.1 nucleotide exchange factor GrpE [Verrucomicrobiota bacterium]